ncbi:hypothetical protein [Paenibacillus sp. Leaf72]|uniref:hypothetical protein n=1 Tax=Paenibacillus sp. Leaf72 TaxID=1736234 RepID=UPI0012DE077E|nr:hypothetical protein [Paenibacillus sp. Leaf72]
MRFRNGEDERKSQHTISARFAPWPLAKDEPDQSIGFPATIQELWTSCYLGQHHFR